MDWFINRCRGRGIWIDILVVRLFTLSFYLKKKAQERKAGIKGDCAAIRFAPIRRSFPLYVFPLMTAQPIAQRRVIVRNARQALRLAFLIGGMHVQRFSFSRSQSVYTRFFDYYRVICFPAAIVCIHTVEVQAKKRGSASLRSQTVRWMRQKG